MSSFERYSAYRDSGIEWLGEIPKHWELEVSKRFHFNLKELNTKRTCNNVLSLTLRGVVNNNIDSPEGLVPKDYATYQIFKKNDLVFKLIDLENISTSRVGLVHENGIMSSAYIRLIVGKDSLPKYAYYYYFNLYLNQVYNNLGSGVRSTLSPTDLLNIKYIKPPKQEQQKIASFLDKKTKQIDQAIEQKEQLIELLKERRQILINDAVTKGLDRTVSFKDSGVEWIEEIPEHWEVKKLKYVFNFSKGLTITKDNLKDKGIKCVNYGEIHSKYGFEINPEIHDLKCVNVNYLESDKKSLLNFGDFIYADTSEDIEGSGNFTYLNSNIKTFAGYHTVICRPKIEIDSRFFAYEFDSSTFRYQIQRKVKGVKVYSITQGMLKDISLWIPPLCEQQELVKFIDNKTSKIDKTINLQQQQIKKLKEYKTTLIDSVVTGKVKVS